MPKFSVEVKVIAECSYTVEVEAGAGDYGRAEALALAQWRNRVPNDFQVDKNYIVRWDTDATQTTWECHECEKPITEEQNDRFDELCPGCYLLWEDGSGGTPN